MKRPPIICLFIAVFSMELLAQNSIETLPLPLIEVQMDLHNPYYLADGEDNFIYLYINAKAAPYPKQQKNTPLNLSLALDRSGSMSGAKLKYAREASKVVIDHLDENDRLSIIAYDHEIEVMQASTSLINKKTRRQLKKKVDAIFDNGQTNLGGGMLEGFKQVKSHYQKKYVNRVLLLSDGLANKGITDSDILKDTAQHFNLHKNISLSTFGLGADFDEDLMQGLAVHSSANYYFIDKAVKVTETLLNELQILQSIVSQKEQLEIIFPANLLQLEEAYGLPVQSHKGRITIPFSNMFAEEEKSVLLKFLIENPLKKPLEISSNFSYTGIVLPYLYESKKSLQKVLTICPTHHLEEWKMAKNKDVYQEIALYEGNTVFRKAIEAVDANNINVAKNLLTQNIGYLQNQIIENEANKPLLRLLKCNESYLEKVNEYETLSRYESKILQKATKNQHYLLLKKQIE